jgi:hypothetical protein
MLSAVPKHRGKPATGRVLWRAYGGCTAGRLRRLACWTMAALTVGEEIQNARRLTLLAFHRNVHAVAVGPAGFKVETITGAQHVQFEVVD